MEKVGWSNIGEWNESSRMIHGLWKRRVSKGKDRNDVSTVSWQKARATGLQHYHTLLRSLHPLFSLRIPPYTAADATTPASKPDDSFRQNSNVLDEPYLVPSSVAHPRFGSLPRQIDACYFSLSRFRKYQEILFYQILAYVTRQDVRRNANPPNESYHSV